MRRDLLIKISFISLFTGSYEHAIIGHALSPLVTTHKTANETFLPTQVLADIYCYSRHTNTHSSLKETNITPITEIPNRSK